MLLATAIALLAVVAEQVAERPMHGCTLPPGHGWGAREWVEHAQTGTGSSAALAQFDAAVESHISPFIRTPPSQVERLVALGTIGADDCVADLGFGDGAMLVAIVLSSGCSGIGVEVNGDLVAQARTVSSQAICHGS